ncbi:MAG: hypothetical protein ACE5EW_00400 [Thermoplasmata archaeon]
MAIPLATPAIAEEGGGYSLTGDLRSMVRVERRSETGNPDTDRLQVHQAYNVTAAGPIYDARLASFTTTGSFTLDDLKVDTDPRPDRHVRLLSVSSSLSLLSATRFPLGLRFTMSDGESNGTSTSGMSYGATWNANFKKLPALQLSYDRSETETDQFSGTRNLTIDSARIRLSKRLARSSYELEYERRDTDDNLGFGQLGNHARFFSNHRFDRAWNLTTSAQFDLEDRDLPTGGGDSSNVLLSTGGGESSNVLLSTLVSYVPDPDLSASGSLQFSRTEVRDSFNQTAGGSVRASRRFRLLPELQGNTFASGSFTLYDSSFLPGNEDTFWSTNLGGDLVSTQLRPVRVGVGYSLALSEGAAAAVAPVGNFAVGLPEAGGLQTAQRINLNVTSRTLAPYTLSGDYTLFLQRGPFDRLSHTALLQATGSPFRGLSFRAGLQGSHADNPDVKVLSGDLSATYSPLFNLSLTGGASISVLESGEQFTFINRLPLILRYRPDRLTTIVVEGFREDIDNTVGPDRLTYEARLRVERPFRQLRLALEFRYRDSESGDSHRREAEIMFTISRPFAYSF